MLMAYRDLSVNKDIYISQLFGFTPRVFVEFFYNVVSREIGSALTQIESYIKEEPSLCRDVTVADLKQGSEQLRQIYDQCLAKNVDRLEAYLENNILKIPNNVVLLEDKVQEKCSCNHEKKSSLESSIMDVEAKIKASYFSRLSMQNEMQLIEKLKQHAEQLLGAMNSPVSCSQCLLEEKTTNELHKNGKTCIDVFADVLAIDFHKKISSDLKDCVSCSAKKQKSS